MQDGCRCRRGLKSSQCSDQLTEETILDNLYNCLELSHVELDLVHVFGTAAVTNALGCPGVDPSGWPLIPALTKSWYFSANTWEQQETTT
ncbi:unnamed protein product [Pocillopora meandrina]|uniref:Uncharacterized protein n=1 Tax=Pocillopora meandrina TaxID=46732 RepID=A0AAU9VX52_9CNID|nr:unnamed protein product [Pocillopora meandrina]